MGVEDTLSCSVRPAVDRETRAVSVVGIALVVNQALESDVSRAICVDSFEEKSVDRTLVATVEIGAAVALVIVELPTYLDGRSRLETGDNPFVVATGA